jgi:hypothetical protein
MAQKLIRELHAPAPYGGLVVAERPRNYEPSARLSYRPDIDGLRAIAVIAVIASTPFQIPSEADLLALTCSSSSSGFLITGLILTELERGEFSFLRSTTGGSNAFSLRSLSF